MCLHELVRLVIRDSTRFADKNSEPQAQVRLLKFPEQNTNFSKPQII